MCRLEVEWPSVRCGCAGPHGPELRASWVGRGLRQGERQGAFAAFGIRVG